MKKQKLEQQINTQKIRQGYLFKRSKFLKQWRKRWVVLTQNYMLTFTHDDCRQLTDVILLSTIQGYKSYLSKENSMNAESFKISCVDSETYLNCKDVEEKWSWIVSLERLVKFRGKNLKHQDFIKQVNGKGLDSYDFYLSTSLQKQSSSSVGTSLSSSSKLQEQKKAQSLINEVKKQQKILAHEKQELLKYKKHLDQEKKLMNKTIGQLNQEARVRSHTIENPDDGTFQLKMLVKENLIHNIFDEFNNKDNYWGLKHYLFFLRKIVQNKKLSFQDIFLKEMLNETTRKVFLDALISIFCESKKPQEFKDYLQFMMFLFSNVGKWLFSIKELEKIQDKIIYQLRSLGSKISSPQHVQTTFYLLKVFQLILERQKTEIQLEIIDFLLQSLITLKGQGKIEQLKEVALKLQIQLSEMKLQIQSNKAQN